MVGSRTAKRRRTERTIRPKRSGRFAESAGKFLSRLILVANACEKSILGSGVGSLGPAAKSAPRALHKAAAGSVQNLLGIIIVIVVIIGKRFL